MHFEELDERNQGEVRSLILAGLADHWGATDETLNPDLDDMMRSYEGGRTVVVRDDGLIIGTGTLLPRGDSTAEILRMSVARGSRRHGVGRRIVDELVATAAGWGVSLVVLETSTSWKEVVRFYLECGFVVTHLEEGDFGSDTWFERQIAPLTDPG